MSLIVLGTVAIDNIHTPTGLKNDLLGGSASHFAMSASMFTKVHIASIIGTDFPEKHLTFLRNKGVDLTSLIERNGKSFRWVGEYKDGDYNNAITHSTELGVLENYAPQVAYEQRNIPYVFLANFDPDLQHKFLSIMSKKKFVGMDTMNLWIDIKRDAVLKTMKKVDLFVLNDGEAQALSEESNLIKAAKKLQKLGPKYVVIKKGEHGVLFYSKGFAFSYSAYPVEKVLDPTGAGDTFAGALMGYLAKSQKHTEKEFKKAVHYATTMASFNVEAFGMKKTSGLKLKDVNSRIKEYKKFTSH